LIPADEFWKKCDAREFGKPPQLDNLDFQK